MFECCILLWSKLACFVFCLLCWMSEIQNTKVLGGQLFNACLYESYLIQNTILDGQLCHSCVWMLFNTKKWPSWGRLYAPKCVTPVVSAWSHRSSISISWYLTFHDIWHHASCIILCNCNCVIWHFVSFDISCHLTFCVISHFVSFDISCDISDLIHHSNKCHQSHHSIYVQVVVEDRCVLKKWVRV